LDLVKLEMLFEGFGVIQPSLSGRLHPENSPAGKLFRRRSQGLFSIVMI
jgi:hypothetical protein